MIFQKLIYGISQVKQSGEYRKVLKNFGFLSLIQIGNFILPLISLPYLVVVLGAKYFGVIMIAQAISQYFVIVTDYGFNYSASREIAIHQNDSDRISTIFCSVMVLKISLFVLSAVVAVLGIWYFEQDPVFRTVYGISFMSVLGNVLFPVWFFQGIGQMKYITFVNVTSKVLSVVLIFVYIHEPDDFVRVPWINSMASVFPSAVALALIPKISPLRFSIPNWVNLKSELRNGWYIFLSAIATSLYSVSNTILLGAWFNPAYAGYYSFGEKIIRAVTALYVPVNNALFPFMSVKMKQSRAAGIALFMSLLKAFIVLTTLGAGVLYLTCDWLIELTNPEFAPSAIVIKILCPVLIAVGISNLIGFQVLYTHAMEKKYLVIVAAAGMINLAICFFLKDALLYKAPAVSLLISETFISFSFLMILRRFVKVQI